MFAHSVKQKGGVRDWWAGTNKFNLIEDDNAGGGDGETLY